MSSKQNKNIFEWQSHTMTLISTSYTCMYTMYTIDVKAYYYKMLEIINFHLSMCTYKYMCIHTCINNQ